MARYIFYGFVLLSFFFTQSCASIIGENTQLIGISSTPEEASIKIVDEKSVSIFTGKTPTNVTLHKSDGSYFGGKNYLVTISKEGFQPVDVQIKSKPNGWYLGGNLVFGGLIGWLIVDPLSGAMYNLSPEHVNAELPEKTASQSVLNNYSISIVLVENVPDKLKDKMVKIR